MNTPRHHNLGIFVHIDAGKTTITETMWKIGQQMTEEQEEERKREPKGLTVGDRIATKLIEQLLK
ncbi:MAG: GTP-binding protein [Candidatus Gracilibacteria bacterium]